MNTACTPAASLVVLFVARPAVSREFYRALLLRDPIVDEPGMVILAPSPGVELGLMSEEGIRSVVPGLEPVGSRAPRCEVYFRLADPEAAVERALQAGGRLLSPLAPRSWNECVAYLLDPDGHLVACAALAGGIDTEM